MYGQAVFAAVSALVLTGTMHAQSLVGRKPPATLPTPVLLDTAGMFLDRYAKVGDDLFIAGQPTQAALRAMKAQGVTTVINLRMPQEMARIGFDEEKLIAELGMTYVYIPVRGTGLPDSTYSPVTLARFTRAIEAARGKVLLHCTVAWRASHLWGAYLIQEGIDPMATIRHTRAINLMDEHRVEGGRQPIEMFLGRAVPGLGKP